MKKLPTLLFCIMEYLAELIRIPIKNTICGDKSVTVNSIEEVMNKPFFDGKSLTAILSDIQIQDF